MPEVCDLLREPEDDDEQDEQDDPDRLQERARVVERPAEVERRPEDVGPRQEALDARPQDEAARDREVEEAQEDDRRGDRGVSGALDAALGEEDSDRVAAPRRNDRVDADTGEDGSDDRAPPDSCLRIRALEDASPGSADRQEPEDVADDSEPERAPPERRQPVEEDVDGMPDRVEQLVPLPVMPPSSWVASPRRRLVGADQKRPCRLCRRGRLKPEAALVRGQGSKPWQGRGWTLAPRDRGPGAGMYCWKGHHAPHGTASELA